MVQPKYPTVDDLIEINRRVLNQIRVRKADRPALTGRKSCLG